MNEGWKNFIIYTSIILIVALIVGITFIIQEYSKEELTIEEITCIAENSVLFSSKTCFHCFQQKEILGDNIDLFWIIYADESPEILEEFDINVFPTWIIGEETYLGVQSLGKLKELTGC